MRGLQVGVAMRGDAASAAVAVGVRRRLEAAGHRCRISIVGRSRHGFGLADLWRTSDADVLAYLDPSVPEPEEALLRAVTLVAEHQADLVVGQQPAGRELSATVIGLGFGLRLRDPSPPVIAARAGVVRPLLSRVSARDSFFLVELALAGVRHGLRVRLIQVGGAGQAPVRSGHRWIRLAKLAHAMGGDPAGPPPPRAAGAVRFALFTMVGCLSALVYVVIYAGLRTVSPPTVSNFGALLLGAVFNTEANRRWTFSAPNTAPVGRVGMHLRAGLLFAVHYLATTAAVLVLLAADPAAARATEVAVLLAASFVVSVLRFVGLDRWVFRADRRTSRAASPAGR